MKLKSFMVIERDGGYPFGLAAHAADRTEIHGPFPDAITAAAYGVRLSEAFEDYEVMVVVKIELPEVMQVCMSERFA